MLIQSTTVLYFKQIRGGSARSPAGYALFAILWPPKPLPLTTSLTIQSKVRRQGYGMTLLQGISNNVRPSRTKRLHEVCAASPDNADRSARSFLFIGRKTAASLREFTREAKWFLASLILVQLILHLHLFWFVSPRKISLPGITTWRSDISKRRLCLKCNQKIELLHEQFYFAAWSGVTLMYDEWKLITDNFANSATSRWIIAHRRGSH